MYVDSSCVGVGSGAGTTEAQLREFFSYCGDIASVRISGVDPAIGTATAEVVFVHPDSVDIAELLSGATVNNAAISVAYAGNSPQPETPTDSRRSAVRAVNGMEASGLLQGGKELVNKVKARAYALDTKYGIKDTVVAGAQAVKGQVTGAVKYVLGRTDVGEVQVACWYWKPNQPQWGVDPRDEYRRKLAYLSSS